MTTPDTHAAPKPGKPPVWPTPEDYLNGRMPDGSKPPVFSVLIADLWEKPIDGESPRAENSLRARLDDLHRCSDAELLAIYDDAVESLKDLKRVGDAQVKHLLAHPEELHPEPTEGCERADDPPPADKPARPRLPMPRAPRVGPATKVVSLLALHQHTIKLLVEISRDRNDFIHELVERAAARDKRREFLDDRAHGVVRQTLLALDKQFVDVGFGSWMPFRFPDQWLMFCGVMRRVLAANGLIHSDNPEAYRRLLEETPPVLEPDGPHTKERGPNGVRPLEFRMPRSWSKLRRLREVESLEKLYAIVRSDNPRPPP